MKRTSKHLGPPLQVTPDGRYFLVRGRLWRMTDPTLPKEERDRWVHQLMDARRAVRNATTAKEMQAARQGVERAKRALGERGPVWWTDGAPDFNRRLVGNTPYAPWHATLNLRDPKRT